MAVSQVSTINLQYQVRVVSYVIFVNDFFLAA